MRQFDYTTVPAELEATPITNLLLSIREHKGRQLALSQVKPELLSSLMEEAKIQSTQSSNGLEGIVTTQKRLKAIMAYSAKPSSRAEEEIAGYRDALSLIHEQHDFIPVTPSVILQLHRDLMAHTAISYGGHWKDSDNEIISIDDQGNRFVRFRPPSALATPDLSKKPVGPQRRLISSSLRPLLISFRFIFDFVSIHPFNDGNGRMSRLLTTLLLERLDTTLRVTSASNDLLKTTRRSTTTPSLQAPLDGMKIKTPKHPLSVSCSEQPWPPTDSSSSVP